MMVVPDYGCEKCKSKLIFIDDIQIDGFDSVRLETCECNDFFHANLSVRDPREKEVEKILMEAGLSGEQLPQVRDQIGVVVSDVGLGFGSRSMHIGSEVAGDLWRVITRRWDRPENPDRPSERIEGYCKINLDLLMLEVFKNHEIKNISDEDINRLFRWPLKLFAASGRLHLGKECWRLK